MLPGIINQLGTESLSNLKKLATSVSGGGDHHKANPAEIDDDDDDVPGAYAQSVLHHFVALSNDTSDYWFLVHLRSDFKQAFVLKYSVISIFQIWWRTSTKLQRER